MNDLHIENDKSLVKEIEKVTSKLKDILNSWMGRINTVHMSILPKATYIKIPMAFCIEIEQSKNLHGTTKDTKWPKQS